MTVRRLTSNPLNTVAVAVDAEAQTAPDALAPPTFRAHVPEDADLEDVRVVPPFLKGGVAEDEADRGARRRQADLVLHDLLVRETGLLAALVCCLLGVDQALNASAAAVDREVPLVCLGRDRLCGPAAQKLVELWLGRDLRVLLFEDPGVLAGLSFAVLVIDPVLGDRVDEEEAEHLDFAAVKRELIFLAQVLSDGLRDHLPGAFAQTDLSTDCLADLHLAVVGEPNMLAPGTTLMLSTIRSRYRSRSA